MLKRLFFIVTQGYLMGRDIGILSSLAHGELTQARNLVTSLNTSLARKLEPLAQSPKQRLIIAVIPVHIMASLTIPGLIDPEMAGPPESVKDAGAKSASWIRLRLAREFSQLI